MSVYSGFATRKQQIKYNNLTENLVTALKKRLLKFYSNQSCDQNKFRLLLKKIYKQMFLLEMGKFMAPKYTICVSDLIESLNITINYDQMQDQQIVISRVYAHRHYHNDSEIFKLKPILQKIPNIQINKQINSDYQYLHQPAGKLKTFEERDSDHYGRRKNSVHYGNLGVKEEDHHYANFRISKHVSKFKLDQPNQMKQIRQKCSMPKIEDFLPNLQQLKSNFVNSRAHAHRQIKNNSKNKFEKLRTSPTKQQYY